MPVELDPVEAQHTVFRRQKVGGVIAGDEDVRVSLAGLDINALAGPAASLRAYATTIFHVCRA
jgi:hypothetical protein